MSFTLKTESVPGPEKPDQGLPLLNQNRSLLSRGTKALLAALLLGVGLLSTPASAAGSTVTVNPTEHFDLMRTPGSGFQDSTGLMPSAAELAACQLEGGPVAAPDAAGLKSGSIYVRLMWRELEPAEDQYSWTEMDRIFECAEQQNKTIDFRLMTSYPDEGETDCIDGGTEIDTATHGIPCWLVQKGVSELFYSGSQTNAIVVDTYLPDWEDPVIRQHHTELLTKFANRYGSNSRLNSVDIGSVGLWGEWHTYPDDSLNASDQRSIEIIDLYANLFPDTPLIALIEIFKQDLGGDSVVADHLRNNYAGRFGWRADSWGQLGHHDYDYAPVAAANPDLWKTGPVTMETTDVMSGWAPRQDDSGDYGSVVPIERAVSDALEWHTTLTQNKGSGIPAAFLSEVQSMASQMGPRLFLSQLSYEDEVSAGSSLSVSSSWHNRGVAPLYRDFRLAFRFTNASGQEQIVTTSETMKGLLPTTTAPVTKSTSVPIPASMDSGSWTVDVGVVYQNDSTLRIPIAITSPNDADWYQMGSLKVLGGTSGTSQITGIEVSVPTGNGDAIVDGDGDTSWDNNAVFENGYFELDLGSTFAVTQIRYQDDFNRNLRILVDGQQVFEGWTTNGGEDTWSEITVPSTIGQVVRFELLNAPWIVPEEVQVFGTEASVPQIISPTPGATLPGSSALFTVDLNGIPLESSWYFAGSTPGGTEYGTTYVGPTTTKTLTGLPTNGTTIHITYAYKTNGTWKTITQTYTAN